MRLATVLALALVIGTGCQGTPTAVYDDDWGADEAIAGGKADGLLDAAKPLTFGAPVTGFVGESAMEVFSLDLKRNDAFELTMKVTDGDLKPHTTLYFGVSTYVGSLTWKNSPATLLVKTYKATAEGRYYVAARAFRGQGAGHYTLTARCTGGPCAGVPNTEELGVADVATCVQKARRCAFDSLDQFGGSVGPARARSLFEGCLNTAATGSGATCLPACGKPDAKELCDAIIGDLPYYADQSADCLGVLDSCMADCYAAGGDGDPDEIWTTAEGICWLHGFNGNCNSYARSTTQCTGAVDPDGHEGCMGLCEATTGAWNDDLDTLCTEACPE